MRRFFLLLASLAPVAAVAQSGKELLDKYEAKLNAAKSLTASYTVQILGGAPSDYSITLSKPNLARVDTPKVLAVADGSNITYFNKQDKTYYKEPQTDEALANLFTQEDGRIWLPFFRTGALSGLKDVKYDGPVTKRGIQLTKLEAVLDPSGKRSTAIYLDSDSLPRQQEITQADPRGNSTLLLFARDLQVGDQPIALDKIAFKAPDGAREMSLDELNANKWYENIDEAKAAAARTHKLVMVDFYADW